MKVGYFLVIDLIKKGVVYIYLVEGRGDWDLDGIFMGGREEWGSEDYCLGN